MSVRQVENLTDLAGSSVICLECSDHHIMERVPAPVDPVDLLAAAAGEDTAKHHMPHFVDHFLTQH